MRIGIIGLGDIATKAYLPVITTKEELEIILCSRNSSILTKVADMYRIPDYTTNLEELINSGIEAAFLHASTDAHVEIARKLLQKGIHVYVDKPLSYHYKEAEQLANLAKEKGKILMVGFNRRFAPMYSELKKQNSPSLILMQKNRLFNPDNGRRFIFDDFIHVVDTLRFLSPGAVENISIKALKKQGSLYNITLQLSGQGFNSIGIMNRDSGITEEILEYMNPGNKWIVNNLVETLHFNQNNQNTYKFNDWDPILYRRGFYQIIDHFLHSVKNNITPSPSIEDSLMTHEICERIVEQL